MYDSVDLDEAVSDLFDSGIQDYTLALLYDANQNINVRVKTPCELGVVQNVCPDDHKKVSFYSFQEIFFHQNWQD